MRKSALGAGVMVCLPVAASRGQVTFFDTQAAFTGASQTSLATDFESVPLGQRGNVLNEGGLTFTTLAAPLEIIGPGNPGTTNPIPATRMLAANGQEDFEITFGTFFPRAVGFTTLSNNSQPVVVRVFDANDVLVGTHTLPQPPNTIGYFGVVSDMTIGKIRWTADRGQAQNTAIDNVLVGVPAPGVGAALLLGAGIAIRRRR